MKMKINWNYFIKQKGVILAGLVVCLVILGSANYIYTKNKNKTDPNDQQPTETYFQASTTQAPDPQTTPNPDDNVDNTGAVSYTHLSVLHCLRTTDKRFSTFTYKK